MDTLALESTMAGLHFIHRFACNQDTSIILMFKTCLVSYGRVEKKARSILFVSKKRGV